MPHPKPATRFLARASLAIAGFAALWWFLLLAPLLSIFKTSAELVAALAFGATPCQLVIETPPDTWHVCVPTHAVVQATRLDSIEFDIPRSDVYIFTFGLPIYCALMVAAARNGSWWRELLIGAALTQLAEIILFVLFLKTFAYGASSDRDPISAWFVHFSQYFEVNVMPDVAPFLIALTVHRELRSKALGWLAADSGNGRNSHRGTAAPERSRRKPARVG